MLYFGYFLLVGVILLLLEFVLPITLYFLAPLGIGCTLIPLLVVHASLEMPDERAPILAAILGFLLDLRSGPGHPVGSTLLILVSISLLIVHRASQSSARPLLFKLLCVLVGTFIYLTLDYLINLIQSRAWYQWIWPFSVWKSITLACLFNLVMTPLLFPLLRSGAQFLGLIPTHRSRSARRYQAT